ncbi:hypothetical protein [Solirubrobacter soli]|uniref:hypothetical protein n=1 Tax=Solirubrobacter soli TaxID=363832 RepID=UPI00041A22F2|nr:hypothetical protein [Solirubrobacter soli]
MRRRVLVIAAAVLVAVAVLVVVLTRGGGEAPRPPRPAPPGLEPLAFMPAGASAVLDFDTRQAPAAFAAIGLIPELPGSPLTANQVQRLTGGWISVALSRGQLWIAAQSRAAPPRPSGGAVAGTRAGTVVIAPDAARLQASLAGAAAAAPTARAEYDRRFTGLPASGARVAFDPGAALAARSPEVARTVWGQSLREGAAVLVVRGDRITLPFQVTADPVKPADLPIATGAGTPQADGEGPVVAAVRSPAQTLAFLRDAGLLPALDVLGRAPGFLRPDVNDLGPQATIVASDQEHLTVRTTPPDPGDWSKKLDRLDALSGLIRFTGLADVRIDRGGDGVYTIENDGELAGRVGVYGPVVVFSTDPGADLAAAARAPAAPPVDGAAGALTVRVAQSLFGSLLPALARGHVGDVTGWARAEVSSVRGELGVQVR